MKVGAAPESHSASERSGRFPSNCGITSASYTFGKGIALLQVTHIVSHVALAGTTEGLDGEHFAFLHLGLVGALDDGDTLAAVDDMLVNVVTVEVPDTLDGVHGSVEFDLVALHRLLDGGADVTHADVNARLADTRVGGILDGLQQRIVHRVEGHGEGTVDNAAVEVRAKVDLHDVAVVEHHLVAGIRGVVRGAVVDAETAGETHTALDVVTLLQALVAGQCTDRILDALRDLRQGLAGLDVLLRILADLTVHFGTLAVLLQEVIVHAVEIALLLIGGSVRVLVLVFDDLAFGVLVVGEQVGHGNAGRRALNFSTALLLLLGLALLLLLGGWDRQVTR